MKKLILTIFCVTAMSSVCNADGWVPAITVPNTIPQIFIPQQPTIIVQKPLTREIQYFLVPHVIELTKPVIKRGIFGRLYIIEEKTLETYNVWQPIEVWK